MNQALSDRAFPFKAPFPYEPFFPFRAESVTGDKEGQGLRLDRLMDMVHRLDLRVSIEVEIVAW